MLSVPERLLELPFVHVIHRSAHLATQTAYEYGQPLYMAGLAESLIHTAKEEGLGRLGFATIHKSLEKK